MALFTAIAAAIGLTGFFASAFVTVASIATSIGLNYAAKALAGNRTQTPSAAAVDHFSAQGTLQAAGDVPRSFNLGYSSTAGSLVYANTWGNLDETPNAYFTQVIALSDLPGGTLEEIWVNGELCTLEGGTPADPELGRAVLEYRKGTDDHLWVKYHDGTQVAADTLLTTRVQSVDRPYLSTRIGTGIAHAICTALVEDTLFTGFPTYKFAVSGIPLYDPSKDSTNGGSGSHRYSTPSTWGGDGDDLPAVQVYNLLRGITYNGTWLYGLQSMTAARLPSVNWIAQIAKCRATILGESGLEPTYRSGGQINVSAQTANAIEALLTACQGRLSEIGGFYKIHLGTPDSPTFSFTDNDILSTEEQNFAPFFGLADSINGITATYPFPGEAWNTKTAPPLYRTDLEARDGSRRLLANPAFDFVPYSAQVQRLMKSALEEAQRARRHTIALPPAFWIVEPGDVGEWTSDRNGYVDKLFRTDGIIDKANLDVVANLTEVDPADYDWNHDDDFRPVSHGPTIFPRPEPQAIVDWFVEPWIIKDTDGLDRRPAIRLSWDGDMPGVAGVQFEVRYFDFDLSDYVVVHRGRTDQLAVGSVIISQSLLPDTDYQARGQYLPSSPRDMLWSDWLDVTTPNVLITAIDLAGYIIDQVTKVTAAMQDQIDTLNSNFDIVKNEIARNWNDKKEHRSQVSAQFDLAYAAITEVETVAVDTQSALADFTTTVTATFGSLTAQVTLNSSAISTLNGYAAARYSVTLSVDGYVSGLTLLNGGSGFSSFTVLADKFQVAFPGQTGGGVVPVFTIAAVGGVPKLVFRGDMIGDGSITVQKITAISLSAISVNAGEITAGVLRSSDSRMLIDLNNRNIIVSD